MNWVNGELSKSLDAVLDGVYLRYVVERLTRIGSSELGFRVAGTREEREAAEFVAAEFESFGLTEVALEPVPVDGWRFRRAYVEVDGRRIECASLGGVGGTPPGGVSGDLVFVGRGARSDVDDVDLRGRIAIVDWRGGDLLLPSHAAAEVARAGASAVVCTSLPGGQWFQGGGALGGGDGYWRPDAVPLVTIRKEDALPLIHRSRVESVEARVVLDVESGSAFGFNVVGRIEGRRRGPAVVVAGHHDGWFSGALDDATGVAATLAIARALGRAGVVPERPIVFASHTAEEYGLADSAFDYCIGAWWQVAQTHREWASNVSFYLNIEGTGMPTALLVEAPPELHRFVRSICLAARRDGVLRQRVVYGKPRPWTEAWPFLAAGIPSVNVNSHHLDFFRREYHTQFDTPAFVDFDNLLELSRVYLRFVLEASALGNGVLDPQARARDFRQQGRLDAVGNAGVETDALAAALDAYEAAAAKATPAQARRAFRTVARSLEAVDSAENPAYMHAQALADAQALNEARSRLAEGDLAGAARAAARCGRNSLAQDLTAAGFTSDLARRRRSHRGIAWGAWTHPVDSPNLWRELSSLRREPGSRRDGRWLTAALERKQGRAAAELERRVERTAKAFHRAAALLGAPTTVEART